MADRSPRAQQQLVAPSASSTNGSRPSNGPPVPVDNATCLALAQSTLNVAREKARATVANSLVEPPGSQQRPGVTIDLSHKGIASIPLEVIELIKDEIERLALAHNQLTSFDPEFAGLPRLRYLNLRSNFLREFPQALTKLPSLEILDISRNRLRVLPNDFGNLINLKVLSMSKNKINVLPTYIAEMSELKILKLDHNPIVFPPKEVWDVEEDDRDVWLENVRRFLRQHAEKTVSAQDTESGSSSDEAGGDHDFPALNPTISRTPSFETDGLDAHTVRGQVSTVRPLRPNGAGDGQSRVPSGSSGNRDGPYRGVRRPQLTPNNGSSPSLSASPLVSGRPQTPQSQSNGVAQPSSVSPHSVSSQGSATERHRSNSESTIQTNKKKRRGMVPPKGQKLSPDSLIPEEAKPYKHHRGYSHDSVIDGVNPNTRSPTDTERRPGQYFRRLSSLPEHKRTSLSSAKVGEAARGILYALSTLQKPLEQYVTSDPHNTHQKAERALYNGNFHLGSLVSALEAYEAKDDEPAVQKVIDACHSCVAAFGQVLGMVQSSLKENGVGCSGPDARYVRTLLLMLYGAYIEIQNCYNTLRPLLVPYAVAENSHSGADAGGVRSQQHQPIVNVPRYVQHNSSNTSGASDSNKSTTITVPAPLATPRSFDSSFTIPVTPGTQHSHHSDSGSFDQDGSLFHKFQAAIQAALSTLPQIERDIKGAAGQNLQPHITLKLREVSSLCLSAAEAARRLGGTRWGAIQDGDVAERKRFWEETNKFTNLVIGIAELIKGMTSEYTFSKPTISAVGTVIRPTKELFVLLNGALFRHLADMPTTAASLSPSVFHQTPQLLPATPLSAALGPAAQATVPQFAYPAGSPVPGSGLSSRTATLVGHGSAYPTFTSEVSVGSGGTGGGVGGMRRV